MRYGPNAYQTLQYWERWRSRAAKADVLTEAERAVGTKGAWKPPGNLSTWGRVAHVGGRVLGAGLGVLNIVSGVQSIADPEHEGWVGVGDQVAGGLSVVAGVGAIGIAAGVAFAPVTLTAIGIAGVAAAGWTIGTFVADEFGDEIKAGAGVVADAVGGALSDAGDVLGDVGSFLNPFD